MLEWIPSGDAWLPETDEYAFCVTNCFRTADNWGWSVHLRKPRAVVDGGELCANAEEGKAAAQRWLDRKQEFVERCAAIRWSDSPAAL